MYKDYYNKQYVLTKTTHIKNPGITNTYFGWRGKIVVNLNSLARSIRGTFFQYSAWEKYTDFNEYILLYLSLFTKYPQVEYLSKRGLSGFIKSYLAKNRVTYSLLNWRSKTMRKILGFEPDKNELRYAAQLSGEKLAAWIAMRKSGCPILLPDLDTYNWLNSNNHSVLQETSEIVPLNKLLSYQKRLKKRGGLSPFFLRDYLDYLKECRELNLDLSRKENLYPNNFSERHLKNQKLLSQKRNPQLDIKIQKRHLKLARKYEYASQNFQTVVPKDSGDFVIEGGRLDHCVARYAERYANEMTDIVFLRKAAEPDTPYYTMEISNGKVVQCRGLRNCAPDAEINTFLEEFRKYCSRKKAKKYAV
jgi:hypothetical protein